MTPAERDLTRLAALAAGYDVYWDEEGGEYLHRKPTVRECGGWRLTWNPRDNDGDSRRLEVKLRIIVCHAPNYVLAMKPIDGIRCYEDEGDDANAATRLCVLRSAAEIAKAQQGGGHDR